MTLPENDYIRPTDSSRPVAGIGVVGGVRRGAADCRLRGNRNTPMNLATIYAPEYATGFTINGIDGMNSTVITVSNPWQGADSVTGMLFLARDGEKAPAGFEGQSVEWPAKRIVAMSSTHIAMLDAIDETGRIVGVSGLGFISNPEIRKRSNTTGDVGYDGNVNYETLISLNPDLVLLYGVNGASSMGRQAARTRHPLHVRGRLSRGSTFGKNRMARGPRRDCRKARGGRK